MSIRTGVLGALAALVAIGGIYLLIEVKKSGAAPPSGQAIAEAARESATTVDKPARAPQIEDLNTRSTPRRPARTGEQAKAPSPAAVDRRLAEKLRRDAVPGIKAEPEDPALNPDFDAAMLQANKLYDRHNYEEARQLALKLLDRQPGTVRMLRVVVSSSCILGDAEMAQKYWLQLPNFDRGQMATRCERFGVTFTP